MCTDVLVRPVAGALWRGTVLTFCTMAWFLVHVREADGSSKEHRCHVQQIF